LSQGEQSTPEYLAINPFGKAPGFKHNDFFMGESAAIMRYLARDAKSSLYPANVQGQAQVDQWMDFVNHHIRANVAKVHFNRRLAKMFGAELGM